MDLPALLAAPLSLAELELRIRAQIKRFDVPALLDLLESIGYDPSEIEFRGHLGASPRPTIIQDIAIRSSSDSAAPSGARITITVNVGLLSCRSPLPSYLQRYCQEVETSDPVIELLRVLDRSLLRTRLTADQPERVLPDWGDVRHNFLRIHGLDSPVGLHWLFRTVFPELGVRVLRMTDGYRVPFDTARLGSASLGRCVFGNTARISVHDMEVTLVSSESTHEGAPWPRVADFRIRRFILPLLEEVCMNLTVAFVLLDRSTRARLVPTSYVGYDPMWGDEGGPEEGLPPARMVLYRGALPLTEPSTDELEQALATHDGELLQLEPRRWDRARAPWDHATPHGDTLELTLVYTPRSGSRYVYDAEVRWGVRAWYVDDPFEMTVAFEGMPKANPTQARHPNLWLWLRDEARARMADRIGIATMALEPDPDERVSLELVERLITAQDREGLHALLWSKLTPLERWDEAAWRRFLEWSES